MASSNKMIERLLVAEAEAEVIVSKARENQVAKMKRAGTAAEEELQIFSAKEEASQAAVDTRVEDEAFQAELAAELEVDKAATKAAYKKVGNAAAMKVVETVLDVNVTMDTHLMRRIHLKYGIKA